MKNSKKLGFPISVVLDEGRPTLRNSLMKLEAGCLFFLLADVVRKKKATAGGLDGWGWREFKVLPVMVLLASCLVLRILVFGLMGCLMLTLL